MLLYCSVYNYCIVFSVDNCKWALLIAVIQTDQPNRASGRSTDGTDFAPRSCCSLYCSYWQTVFVCTYGDVKCSRVCNLKYDYDTNSRKWYYKGRNVLPGKRTSRGNLFRLSSAFCLSQHWYPLLDGRICMGEDKQEGKGRASRSSKGEHWMCVSKEGRWKWNEEGLGLKKIK